MVPRVVDPATEVEDGAVAGPLSTAVEVVAGSPPVVVVTSASVVTGRSVTPAPTSRTAPMLASVARTVAATQAAINPNLFMVPSLDVPTLRVR